MFNVEVAEVRSLRKAEIRCLRYTLLEGYVSLRLAEWPECTSTDDYPPETLASIGWVSETGLLAHYSGAYHPSWVVGMVNLTDGEHSATHEHHYRALTIKPGCVAICPGCVRNWMFEDATGGVWPFAADEMARFASGDKFGVCGVQDLWSPRQLTLDEIVALRQPLFP